VNWVVLTEAGWSDTIVLIEAGVSIKGNMLCPNLVGRMVSLFDCRFVQSLRFQEFTDSQPSPEEDEAVVRVSPTANSEAVQPTHPLFGLGTLLLTAGSCHCFATRSYRTAVHLRGKFKVVTRSMNGCCAQSRASANMNSSGRRVAFILTVMPTCASVILDSNPSTDTTCLLNKVCLY